MEHQTELYLSAKYMIQQSLQQIKDQLDEELLQSTLTSSMMTSKSGLKLESLKEMSTDNRLIYISAQLLATSLCVSLNKEIRKLEIDGVNFLESEKQLESRIYCLKEILTKQIQKHINKTD